MKKIYVFATTIFFIFWLTINAQVNTKNIFKNSDRGFIENRGQIIDQYNNSNPSCLFLYNGYDLNVQLRKTGFSYDVISFEKEKRWVNNHRVDIEFEGCNSSIEIIKDSPLAEYFNFYTTGAPNEGITIVKKFKRILYKNVYNLIDIEFLIIDNKVKYNIIVNSGGNINDIRFGYLGAKKIKIVKNGDIEISTSQGNILESIPYSFEKETNKEVKVYCTLENNVISYNAESTISNQTLIIDPVPNRIWGTYYGGANIDDAFEVETDTSGNIFIGGNTGSFGIATAGVYQSSFAGGTTDAYVAKFNGSNGTLLWATYYGNNGDDMTWGMAIDNNGDAIITGRTTSTTGMASAGSHQTIYGGSEDSFLAKFNGLNGTRFWSTYYGGNGSDYGHDIAIDISNNIYFAGLTSSSINISTPGTYQTSIGGTFDGMVIKFDPNGIIQWGSYYGNSGSEHFQAITLDGNNDIILAGVTSSTSGVASVGAHQTVHGGGFYDGLIVKMNNSGTIRHWATYYGGGGYEYCGGNGNIGGGALKTDAANNIFVAGSVDASSTTGIATAGAYQTVNGGGPNDGFIAKLNSNGIRQWGTYFGGPGTDVVNSLDIDNEGSLIFAGHTNSSTGISTAGSYQTTLLASLGGYFGKFLSNGSISFASYYSGTNFDAINAITKDISNNIILAGTTYSTSGISTPGTHMPVSTGTNDGFLVKFDNPCVSAPLVPGTISGSASICSGTTNTYSITAVAGATSYTWTLPSGWTGTSVTNSINATASATSGNITVTANNACGSSAAQTLSVTVNPIFTTNTTAAICQGDSMLLAGAYQKVAGVYTDNLLSINGCDSTVITTLSINPLPTVTFANLNAVCADAAAFTLIGGMPAGGTYSGIGVNNNQFDAAVAGVGTHTITYTYIDGNTGCSNSATNTILVNPLPPVPIITVNGTTFTSSAANGNQWYLNGSPINGATNQTLVCTVNGNYTVCVTDANGCKSCSAVLSFTTIGISENKQEDEIIIYPNPFSSTITVIAMEQSLLTIYNTLGEVIYSSQLTNQPLKINLEGVPSGIYFIKVINDEDGITKKIIKL